MPPQTSHPRAAFIFGILLVVALGVACLGGFPRTAGTSAFLMENWLDWAAAPELTKADRKPVAELIADTMAGKTAVFQYKGLFSKQAETHMADCVPLFRLARTVGLVGFGIFFLSVGLCVVFHSPRATGMGMLIGTGVLLLFALVLGIWGLVDFDGLFTAFHRTFFTNDDWLFPPGDLLIRLMPLSFFVRCAALIAGLWAAVPIFSAMTAGLLIRKRRAHE